MNLQPKLFLLHEHMQRCVVLKKVGQCTCYELYEEETHAFVLSCVTCTLLSPMLLFVSSPDCHLRKFEDICCNLNIRYFVAKMMPDWMTGLHFKLTSFDESLLCDIKIRNPILSSAPVAFSMKIRNPDFDPDDGSYHSHESACSTAKRRGHSANLSLLSLSWLSCLGDFQCLEASDPDCKAPGATDATYTTIPTSSYNRIMVELQTRSPTWNTELQTFTDHYGGRVRIPCRQNFMAFYGEEQHAVQTPPVGMGGLEEERFARMCIRHGKTGVNSFVLDFRAPATALTAFAAMCAVHS